MDTNTAQLRAWLQPQVILLDIDAHDRREVLAKLAEATSRKHGLECGPVYRALARREEAGSTALSDGFAIPHAQIEGLMQPHTVFMRLRQPIDFQGPDGKPVSDFLAILVPHDGARERHLQMLAMVSALFSDPKFRRDVDAAPNEVATAAVFRSAMLARSLQRAS